MTNDPMRELETITKEVASFVRDATDNPRVGIAACFAAGIFWAQMCKMQKSDLQEMLEAFMHGITKSQNDLDNTSKHH